MSELPSNSFFLFWIIRIPAPEYNFLEPLNGKPEQIIVKKEVRKLNLFVKITKLEWD